MTTDVESNPLRPLARLREVTKWVSPAVAIEVGVIALLFVIGFAVSENFRTLDNVVNIFEQTTFFRRALGPQWWAGWSMIICNAFVSQLLWFKKIRRNVTALFIISIFINIGMWFLMFARTFPIVAIQEVKELIPYPRRKGGH